LCSLGIPKVFFFYLSHSFSYELAQVWYHVFMGRSSAGNSGGGKVLEQCPFTDMSRRYRERERVSERDEGRGRGALVARRRVVERKKGCLVERKNEWPVARVHSG
jgi:hypothetical protein